MKTRGKILSFMLTLAMILGLMPSMDMMAQAADSTVTWNPNFNLFNVNDRYTENGVSVTMTAMQTGGVWQGNNIMMGGGGTLVFNSTVGNIKDITISANNVIFSNNDWIKNGSALEWSGTPASSVTLSGTLIQIMGISSIVFTIEGSTVDVTGVTLDKTSTTLTVGGTETLTATVAPDDATDRTVTWSSDNESVATVDSTGKITAVAAGTATITATATNGTSDTDDDKTAACTVMISEESSSDDTSDDTSGAGSGGTSANTADTATAKVSYEEIAISTGQVKDITGTAEATAESNPYGTKIENSDSLTTLLSLTEAEVAEGVNVWLDVQDMSAAVSQTEQSIIQTASADYTVGAYLDINLFKLVGGNAATKLTETNGALKVSIIIPEAIRGSGRSYEIIRVHNGAAAILPGTYDEATHIFTFETDQFSTYAIAYKDPTAAGVSTASANNTVTTDSGSASDSADTTQINSPKTYDPNYIRLLYLMLLLSIGGLGFTVFLTKKQRHYR